MASRSGSGVGLGVTVAVLGVASLALFVLTIVFLSQSQRANTELKRLQDENAAIIKPEERADPELTRLRDLANRDGNRSLVGYLRTSLESMTRLATGNARDSLTQARSRLIAAVGQDEGSFLDALSTVSTSAAQLEQQVSQADQARAAADSALTAERQAKSRLQDQQRQTVEALTGRIQPSFSENEEFRKGIDQRRLEMDRQIERNRTRYEGEIATLKDNNRRYEQTIFELQDRVSRLQREQSRSILQPRAEYALVDGQVIALNQSERQVTINLGRKDKLFLGVQFAVYSDATAIRPDPRTGEYPPGKATIEVIAVNEDSSVARILPGSEVRGNPVVRGDVIANALYDPRKVYRFVVFGNFDSNNDGLATAAEGEDVRALIQQWGGVIVDSMSGDVDFLVLGSRPVLPPRPRAGDPADIVAEFRRRDDEVRRYDDFFKQATATSLPVLNENRLYTLIGQQRPVRR